MFMADRKCATFVLCIASVSFRTAYAASPVDEWARRILDSVRSSVPFSALESRAAAALMSSKVELELNPLSLEVSGTHTEYPVAGAQMDRLSRLQIGASKYLGGGVELDTTLAASYAAYLKSINMRVPDQQGLQADLTITVDLWRDRFGRYLRSQQQVAALAYQSSVHVLSANVEEKALASLSSALDFCVLAAEREQAEDLIVRVRKLLQQVRLREQAQLISESDLLQFESLMLTIQQSLEQQSLRQTRIYQDFRSAYGTTLKTEDCPSLLLPTTESVATVSKTHGSTVSDQAPLLLAARKEVSMKEEAQNLSDLNLSPTLTPFVSVNGSRFAPKSSDVAGGFFANSRNWGYTAGVALQWDFGNSRLDYAYRAAALELVAAHLSLQEVEKAVSARVADLEAEMSSVQTLVDMLKRQQTLTRKYLEAERARYMLGRSTAFALSSAYQSYFAVANSSANLVGQWYKSRWTIDSINGELLKAQK